MIFSLNALIASPIVAGFLLLLGAKHLSPRMALMVAASGSMFAGLCLWHIGNGFDPSNPAMQQEVLWPWIQSMNAHYHLGVDGFALGLLFLTWFCFPIMAWVAHNQTRNPAVYLGLLWVLQGLLYGVFCALDGLLFYVFWEAVLVPMFLIIGLWGGANRKRAALKFFLYTFLGSIFLLLALMVMHGQAVATNQIMPWSLITFQNMDFSWGSQVFIFWGMLLAFAVKVPMWPVHTWLPDAHVEAPTEGSVVLAAVMLKLGGFGILRFVLPMVPDAARYWATSLVGLSLVAIVYVALVALVQKDMKKLIAYSSITHMGFVTLGLFSLPLLLQGTTPELALWSTQGAYVQMISHGLISGALFFCVGMVYHRLHSRQIQDCGGLAQVMPRLAAFWVFFAMANAGLPGTSGFVGEFLVIMASFAVHPGVALAAGSTLILGAAYTLWMVKRVLFGPVVHPAVAALTDLTGQEKTALSVLAVGVLWLGLWPRPLLYLTEASSQHLLLQVAHTKLSQGA